MFLSSHFRIHTKLLLPPGTSPPPEAESIILAGMTPLAPATSTSKSSGSVSLDSGEESLSVASNGG